MQLAASVLSFLALFNLIPLKFNKSSPTDFIFSSYEATATLQATDTHAIASSPHHFLATASYVLATFSPTKYSRRLLRMNLYLPLRKM